jgi:hypothetical protein
MQLAVLCWAVVICFFDQVSVSSTRWFGDEGLQMLLGVLPQMMFFQRLLDLVVSRDGF